MKRIIVAVFLALAASAQIGAQPPGIASIKRTDHAPPAFTPDRLGRLHSGEAIRQSSDGVITLTNVSLRYLIWSAYGRQGYQVIGGPAWIDADGYDATFPRDTTPEMIQTLLADKFHLKVHRETQLRPSFNLVVTGSVRLPEPRRGTRGDGGKLPPCDRVFFLSNALDIFSRFHVPKDQAGGELWTYGPFWGQIDGERATIKSLVFTLSDILGRTVFDKTKLEGPFDIHMTFYLGDELAGLEGPEAHLGRYFHDQARVHQPHIEEVLKDLGLGLQPDQAPTELLIIDHAEKLPTS